MKYDPPHAAWGHTSYIGPSSDHGCPGGLTSPNLHVHRMRLAIVYERVGGGGLVLALEAKLDGGGAGDGDVIEGVTVVQLD